MHGDATREDFAGLEGPDDPQHLALFAADTDGKLIAVLHHNTTHPSLFWGTSIFSVGFIGEARRILRKELGNVPTLFLNGAQGDIACRNQYALTGRLGRPPKASYRSEAMARSRWSLNVLNKLTIVQVNHPGSLVNRRFGGLVD